MKSRKKFWSLTKYKEAIGPGIKLAEGTILKISCIDKHLNNLCSASSKSQLRTARKLSQHTLKILSLTFSWLICMKRRGRKGTKSINSIKRLSFISCMPTIHLLQYKNGSKLLIFRLSSIWIFKQPIVMEEL